MKIKRNVEGKECSFELTAQELREAFEEQQHVYDKQDALDLIDRTSEYGADADFLDYGLSYFDARDLADEIGTWKRRNMDKYDMTWEYALGEAMRQVFHENAVNKPDELMDAMKDAATEEIMLHFSPLYLNKEHQDCLWYGGEVATALRGNILLTIEARGDVDATLLNDKQEFVASVKDKSNHGRFYEEMSRHIKNDEELHRVVEDGTLLLDNNNWWEWHAYDATKMGETDTLEEIGPSALNNIFEASDMLLEIVQPESLNEIFDYVEEYRKEEQV